MPELPEVETIVNRLRGGWLGQPSLLGQTIQGADLLWQRTLATPSPDDFYRRIDRQKIENIRRRGKYIIFELSFDYLLIHLRMSGDLINEPQSAAFDPYYRLVINLQSGYRLAFQDTRKFGRVWLVSDPQVVLHSLGPEPLDDSITARDFHIWLSERHRQLKPLLIDQSFLAGLGNIYTDEALHLAKLHPLTVSNTLDYPQADKLLQSIREVLRAGIARQGTSIDWVYRGGDYQRYLRVYRRTGEPCLECNTVIQRIVVGQRGTHICPQCQVLERSNSN